MTERQAFEEYSSKKEKVLSNFREEFVKEYYSYDAVFKLIAELLIRDADPYEIIEKLIIDRKKIMEELEELSKHSTVSRTYPPLSM